MLNWHCVCTLPALHLPERIHAPSIAAELLFL